MTSTSRPLVLGRVSGHRANRGELTVRVVSGDAAKWAGIERVLVRPPGSDAASFRSLAVERSRAYRDRLVLKLHGIDDGNAAASLRGYEIAVAAADVPELPEGRYWLDRLIGLRVVAADTGEALGVVVDVLETGAGEVLSIRPSSSSKPSDDDEVLVPLVRDYVVAVNETEMRVRIPDELRRLNRGSGRA